MLKKHLVLLLIVFALLLLIAATLQYPGGSQVNRHSIDYNWTENYISNLFAETAVNGAYNTARWWAVAGMVFLSAGFSLFFIEFSKLIPSKGAAGIIKYVGGSSMGFAFLIATPLHDAMITIASTLFLVSLFYITIFVCKSRLHLFKFLCVICLGIFYATLYLYGSGRVSFLPVMQKINFVATIGLVLGLKYFTRKEDFLPATKEG